MFVGFCAGIFRTGCDIDEDFTGEKAGDGEDIDLDSEVVGNDNDVFMFPVGTGGVDGLDGEEKTALMGRGLS